MGTHDVCRRLVPIHQGHRLNVLPPRLPAGADGAGRPPRVPCVVSRCRSPPGRIAIPGPPSAHADIREEILALRASIAGCPVGADGAISLVLADGDRPDETRAVRRRIRRKSDRHVLGAHEFASHHDCSACAVHDRDSNRFESWPRASPGRPRWPPSSGPPHPALCCVTPTMLPRRRRATTFTDRSATAQHQISAPDSGTTVRWSVSSVGGIGFPTALGEHGHLQRPERRWGS